jgi:hypothetical protein
MKTKMFGSLLVAALLVLAAWGVPVQAATLNVPTVTYPTIQDAINAASPDDTILVAKGYNVAQDLQIYKDGLQLIGDHCKSIIQGVQTVLGTSAPLALPNIDIQANGVRITGFKIRSPVVASTYYSSGIVLVGTNIEIDNNCFEAGTGAGSQAIQTWAFSNATQNPLKDISGLKIHHNTFTNRSPVNAGGDFDSYEGIYINPQGDTINPAKSPVVISDNEFSGQMFRAITVDGRSRVIITRNDISTYLTKTITVLPNFPRGIQLTDNYATSAATTGDILVLGNDIKSSDWSDRDHDHWARCKKPPLHSPFSWGIVIRSPSPLDFTRVMNSLVAGNIVFGAADTGILVQGTGGNNMLNGNQVMKSYNGISVGSDTVLDDNEVVESTNDGIAVGNNNMVRDNQIFGSGVYDLVIAGSSNNFFGNRFKTCYTSGQPCP